MSHSINQQISLINLANNILHSISPQINFLRSENYFTNYSIDEKLELVFSVDDIYEKMCLNSTKKLFRQDDYIVAVIDEHIEDDCFINDDYIKFTLRFSTYKKHLFCIKFTGLYSSVYTPYWFPIIIDTSITKQLTISEFDT